MLRTRENSDVFNSLEEIYLVFTSKKQISSISQGDSKSFHPPAYESLTLEIYMRYDNTELTVTFVMLQLTSRKHDPEINIPLHITFT